MEFKKKQLENGLTIIGESNEGAKSAAVGFFVKTGSRDESYDINGVSHFLEHMLFKGTDKLSAFEVNEAFDRTGAQFNAFTSEENTVYYAAVLPEYLQEVTQLWIELLRPALRDKDFNIEKSVIKEEISMYQDLPSFDVIDRCRKLHFDEHPCGMSVLGTAKSIDGLTANQMRNYFENRYAPNNMVLAVVGNFDWEAICTLAEEGCSGWLTQEASRKLSHYNGSRKKERVEKQNLVREHICLISPAVSVQDKRRYAASLAAAIMGDDVGSRFFWKLVDKALAETATLEFSAMDGTGAFYSYIRCSSDKLSEVLDIVNSIFNELIEKSVNQEELDKARNKALSSLVIKNEVPMGRLVGLGFNWIYCQEYKSVEDDINAIKEVSVEDINSLIKEFRPGDYTQLILGPACDTDT
ncbi:MAG: M16 family metallopeptidase [Planctomycetota bacterium]|jgi:predicted Zn-dependent peptidase